MTPKTIRIVPNISIAALQAKLDKQLAMWYCLRAINQWGSGRLDMEYAVKSSVADFGYSRGTAYRIFSTGNGIFWDKRPLKKSTDFRLKSTAFKKSPSTLTFVVADTLLKFPLMSLWITAERGYCIKGLDYMPSIVR